MRQAVDSHGKRKEKERADNPIHSPVINPSQEKNGELDSIVNIALRLYNCRY